MLFLFVCLCVLLFVVAHHNNTKYAFFLSSVLRWRRFSHEFCCINSNFQECLLPLPQFLFCIYTPFYMSSPTKRKSTPSKTRRVNGTSAEKVTAQQKNGASPTPSKSGKATKKKSENRSAQKKNSSGPVTELSKGYVFRSLKKT